MRFKTIAVLLLTLLPVAAQTSATDPATADAEAYAKASASIDSDLESAMKELAALRQKIAVEKADLGQETAEVAANLRDKRRQADLARLDKDALLHDLHSLSKRVGEWTDERNYIDGLLTEFRKQFDADSHPAELTTLAPLFAKAEGTDDEAFTARVSIAEAAIQKLVANHGTITAPGEALSEDGVAHAGRYVIAGPVSWFVSNDGETSGLTDSGDGLQPRVIPGTSDAKGIASIADGNAAILRFDPTLGAAVAIQQADGSLLDHIRQGGLWIWPILLLALVATIAAVYKWLQLLRIRDLKPAVIRKVLDDLNGGNSKQAMSHLADSAHPAAIVLRRGIELGDGTRSRDAVEEGLYEKFLEAQPPLQRGLPLIAIASASAPLLGLLGTVTGMIHTFKLINIFGTGDAKSLASGISEALITTEFGLIVAIPALILHALLSRKVQGIKSTMEMSSLAFLNGLQKVAK